MGLPTQIPLHPPSRLFCFQRCEIRGDDYSQGVSKRRRQARMTVRERFPQPTAHRERTEYDPTSRQRTSLASHSSHNPTPLASRVSLPPHQTKRPSLKAGPLASLQVD